MITFVQFMKYKIVRITIFYKYGMPVEPLRPLVLAGLVRMAAGLRIAVHIELIITVWLAQKVCLNIMLKPLV